jgi:hypothetical protein
MYLWLTHNGNLCSIHYSIGHQKVHTVKQVLLHLLSPLTIAGIHKFSSEANAPTKIHLQDGIAATAEIILEL